MAEKQRRHDVLAMLAELGREAGMLAGVFGALDGWLENAKDPRFPLIPWLLEVLIVAFAVVFSGIALERLRPIDDG